MTSISSDDYSLRSTELLLARGASPDARDRSGATPLHRAALSLNTGFITQLVASGADVEAKNRDGRTPLMVAATHCYYWNVEALLQAGADPTSAVAPDWSEAVIGPTGTREPKCRATQELLGAAAKRSAGLP